MGSHIPVKGMNASDIYEMNHTRFFLINRTPFGIVIFVAYDIRCNYSGDYRDSLDFVFFF